MSDLIFRLNPEHTGRIWVKVLNDRRLSLAEQALILYLHSYPLEKEWSLDEIVAGNPSDPIEEIEQAVNNLVSHGYLLPVVK